MTPLGKPLVFYLKYMAEMEGLYVEGSEEPDLTGLDEVEHVRELACAVGDAACEKMADFLELCGKGIEEHFNGLGIATLTNKGKRAYLVRNWKWEGKVRLSSAPGGWFDCGVSHPVEGNVIPWVWRRGGRSWAELVMKTLGDRAYSRGGSGVMRNWETGSVALACIQVLDKNLQGFDVDRDPLVAKVVGAFTALRADDVEIMARGVGGEDDSPEAEEPGGPTE